MIILDWHEYCCSWLSNSSFIIERSESFILLRLSRPCSLCLVPIGLLLTYRLQLLHQLAALLLPASNNLQPYTSCWQVSAPELNRSISFLLQLKLASEYTWNHYSLGLGSESGDLPRRSKTSIVDQLLVLLSAPAVAFQRNTEIQAPCFSVGGQLKSCFSCPESSLSDTCSSINGRSDLCFFAGNPAKYCFQCPLCNLANLFFSDGKLGDPWSSCPLSSPVNSCQQLMLHVSCQCSGQFLPSSSSFSAPGQPLTQQYPQM